MLWGTQHPARAPPGRRPAPSRGRRRPRTCAPACPCRWRNRRLLIKQQNKKDAGLYKSMFKALGKGLGSAAAAAVATAVPAPSPSPSADAAGGADQAAGAGATAEAMPVDEARPVEAAA